MSDNNAFLLSEDILDNFIRFQIIDFGAIVLILFSINIIFTVEKCNIKAD
jgi:hypothetical protein